MGFSSSPLGFFLSVRLLRNFIKVIDRLRISSHDADYKSMNRNSFSSKCGASPPPDLLLTSCGKLPIVLLLQRGVRRVLFLQRVVRHWRRKRVSGLDQSGTWRPRRGPRGADSGRRRGQPLERGGCSSAHLHICSSGQEMDAATFPSLNTQNLYVNNYFVQLHLLWINCTLLCYNSLLTEIQISMPEII